jgi:hypothetical protein
MSARLHLVVEGQTEETYVNRVLVPHLADREVWADVRVVETGRQRGLISRGGLREYRKLRNDLVRWMKQDDHPDVFFTTMIDLYGLQAVRGPFPGCDETKQVRDPYEKVARMEAAWARDIDHHRFIPHIQLHEFETLLLASPHNLKAVFASQDAQINQLAVMVTTFATPELIDDGEQTSPSKRIIAKLPQYAGMKTSAGPIVAEKIGLPVLRTKCRHFAEWLSRVETLGSGNNL